MTEAIFSTSSDNRNFEDSITEAARTEFLYDLRSKFVHEARLVLSLVGTFNEGEKVC
jgi:hypothetical protein